MKNCRICQNSVSQYQTFCSHCGARRIVVTPRGAVRRNVFSRLKDSFREGFRSETEKRFDAACELARFGFDAAIPSLEEVVDLAPENSRYRETLAVFYAGAGDERLGLISQGGLFPPWGPLTELRSMNILAGTFAGELKAKEILSWVSKVKQFGGEKLLQADETGEEYLQAYDGLDKALNGSLKMFDNSFVTDPSYPGANSGRASAYQKVADEILMAYGIFPVCFWTHAENESEWEPVKYGDTLLGMCIKQEMPNLEFLTEILWLYEQAEEEYKVALRLDPADTKSYVELSHVLRQLGKENKAANNLNKALAILNKAIQVDNADERSYSERAEIFEELGEIESAISDLERLLTLSTWEFKLDRTRKKIEKLRKSKEARGTE